MRVLLFAALAAATVLPAGAASAQSWGGGYRHYGYGRGNSEVRQEQRECQRELRRADSRREYNRELRECRREIREARRDSWRDGRRYDDRRGYYGRYRRY
jgi:hypothetical protein